ncbi:MAG: hypothetical protein ACR2PL_09570 [Dehalococcoidia bacterium]
MRKEIVREVVPIVDLDISPHRREVSSKLRSDLALDPSGLGQQQDADLAHRSMALRDLSQSLTHW